MTRRPSTPMRAFGLLIVALWGLLLASAPARAAQVEPCAPATLAWIAAAQSALGAEIAPVDCPAARARVRLSPEGAAPIDVDIAEPPGPAFRRVGRLRVSPIVEVPDWQLVPAAQRDAFEALCAWLAAHEAEVILWAPPPVRLPRALAGPVPGFRGPWLLLGALVLLGLAARPRALVRPAGRRRDARVLAILFLGALALRIALGPFAPHHVNGQGPLWILGAAADPSRLGGYGPGYPEIFSLSLAVTAHRPDLTLFATNAALSAALVPLVFALGRALELHPRRALAAAALVAVDPVCIRMGATEAYFTPVLALVLGAALLLSVGARRLQAHPRGALLLSLAGALLGAEAARVHPVAWGPLLLVPAVVFGAMLARPASIRRAAVLALGAASLLALVIGLSSGGWIAAVAAGVGGHWDALGGARVLLGRAGYALPIGVSILAVPSLRRRLRACLLPALAALAALVLTRGAYAQSALWQASYDRLYLALPLLALAALLPLPRRRAFGVLLGATLTLVLASGWPLMRARTTEQEEHRFFRAALAALPPGCRVAYVPRAGKRVVALPEYALPLMGDEARPFLSPAGAADVLGAGGCVRWARTSLCTSAEGRATCEAIERGLDLAPLDRATLSARPSHDDLPYDRDAVEIGLFEVRGPSR